MTTTGILFGQSDVIARVDPVRIGRIRTAGGFTISFPVDILLFLFHNTTLPLLHLIFQFFFSWTMTLDYVSSTILSVIKVLDSLGTESWSATAVVLSSLGVLLAIKVAVSNKRGVDWYCLLHAIITGVGSCMCVWLNVFAAETMTGISGA